MGVSEGVGETERGGGTEGEVVAVTEEVGGEIGVRGSLMLQLSPSDATILHLPVSGRLLLYPDNCS